MFRYIMSRIAAMLITLFLIMSLSFIVVRLMPMSLFENPEVPLEIQKQLEDKFHLNDPLPVQYFYFISDIVAELDFGVSVKLRPGLPVFGILINRLPPTILVNFLSLFISIPLGLIAGTVAALKRNTWVDHVISFFVVIFISVPSFVFASALQYFLAFKLEWFPTLYDTNAATLAQQLHSLVLPIIALALSPIATIARYLRGELIENISSEYLLLARTKGLTKVQSIVRHAFRNSLIPISNTLIAMITGIMGGSLVIENIFAIPGQGGLTVKSIMAGDHFLTVACLIFYSVTSLVTILLVDLSYGLIDPRVRVGGKKEPDMTRTSRCLVSHYNAGITRFGESSGVLHCKACDGKCVQARAALTPERENKRQNGRRFKNVGEPGFTLTAVDRHGVMMLQCPYYAGMPIREATKQGYVIARHGDGVNLSYPNSTVSRGRVGKQCAQTLVTGGSMGVVVYCRIRRLTPRECFRLQAFEDFLFDRAKAAGVSDAQFYKQAGNSVTVNIVYEIGLRLAEMEAGILEV